MSRNTLKIIVLSLDLCTFHAIPFKMSFEVFAFSLQSLKKIVKDLTFPLEIIQSKVESRTSEIQDVFRISPILLVE